MVLLHLFVKNVALVFPDDQNQQQRRLGDLPLHRISLQNRAMHLHNQPHYPTPQRIKSVSVAHIFTADPSLDNNINIFCQRLCLFDLFRS